MAIGRPRAALTVSDEQRETLQCWARRGKTSQALATRARIILRSAEDVPNVQIQKELRVSHQTVCKWRERFRRTGVDGLLDEPRPRAPRRIGDDQVEAVVVKTLQVCPRDATHWSTRSMAKATGMSQSAISRIWRAFGLQPHRTETFKLSNDPMFVEKVRDIVGLYLDRGCQDVCVSAWPDGSRADSRRARDGQGHGNQVDDGSLRLGAGAAA